MNHRPFTPPSPLKSATKVALLATLSLGLLAGCGGEPKSTNTHDPSSTQDSEAYTNNSAAQAPAGEKVAGTPAASPADPATILDQVLAGPQRSDEQRARDEFRHPKETLLFFGVSPDQTVVEMFPGGGWYTRVIAPYIAAGNGTYVAVNSDPGDSERRRERLNAFKDAFSDEAVFGTIQHGTFGGDTPMVEPGSADVVLTFRNVHNWMRGDVTDQMFSNFYDALKPGGVLGLTEHRGDPAVEQDPKGSTGYVREDVVIAMAEKAGFVLDATSEINANPKDDRDHPFGVWTLKPVRRSSSSGEPAADFDRAAYDAIGESDRMTLRFRKPVGADGALLE